MYEAGTVVAIDLALPAEELGKLEAEPFEYVKGTFSLASTDGTPGGGETPIVTSLPTEVRLKGNVKGSFRPLTGKAAFKLKFSKKEPFLGLRKMTLNNMVEDYSLVHETLAHRAFRAAGVPAPRTGFAYVRVNGEDFGIYLNIENLDKVNLERWFGPFDDPQHLYEGEYGTDVNPGEVGKFEVDEGDEEDRSDLEALIAATNASQGPGWSVQMEPFADLGEMTRMWAVEKYIGHWDGYAGREDEGKPNNYYLYSDPAGRFQMLPWGTDLTWMERIPFGAPGGLLFNKCLADPGCEALFREQLRAVGALVAGLDLSSLAASTAELLGPWAAVDPRLEHPELVEGAVAATLDFVADRPGELAAWLGPGPTSGPAQTSLSGAQGESDAIGPRSIVKIDRLSVARGTLVTRLTVSRAGRVDQRVAIRTEHGALRACTTEAAAREAGSLTMRCDLPTGVQRRRRARWLKLNVTTRFTAADGGVVESVSRRVFLPRTVPK